MSDEMSRLVERFCDCRGLGARIVEDAEQAAVVEYIDRLRAELAEAKAQRVPDDVVWQYRQRGGDYWKDAECVEHADALMRRSFIVQGVVIVSPKGDTPVLQRAMLAASKPAAVPEIFHGTTDALAKLSVNKRSDHHE